LRRAEEGSSRARFSIGGSGRRAGHAIAGQARTVIGPAIRLAGHGPRIAGTGHWVVRAGQRVPGTVREIRGAGHECREYNGFLRGAYFVFDSPTSFHTLAPRGDEIFRVDVEITEQE